MPRWYYNKEAKEALKSAQNDECPICDGKSKATFYALCDGCDKWYHPRCLNQDPKIIQKARNFLCNKCGTTNDADHQTQEQQMENEQTSGDISFSDQFNEPTQNNDHSSEPSGKASQESTDHNNSTDDEGYKAVDYFKDHRTKNGKREFLAVYKDEDEQWVKETDCDGCVDFLNIYCESNRIPTTTVQYKEGCGAISGRKPNKNLWAPIDRIKDMVISYGNREAIQPKIFSRINQGEDSLQLIQIGSHCFALLYISEIKTCYLADGQNTFSKHGKSRKMVLKKLSGVKFLKFLPFNGQKEEDNCASSAAAIAIEFQRLHNIKQLPMEPLLVADGTLERIRKVLHKGSGEKINTWSPIVGEAWKVKCDNCGAKFKTKNRGALNLHKCA